MPLKNTTNPSGGATSRGRGAKNNPFGCRNLLDDEIKLYEKKLNSFMRQHKNQYVLIKGNLVEGFYDKEKDAIKVGTEKYALTGSFLVRKVTKEPEKIIYIPTFQIVDKKFNNNKIHQKITVGHFSNQ